MRTPKFEAQPTNTFLATVNQMFGSSSQFPTTAERVVIKSLSTWAEHSSDNETVLGRSLKLGGATEHPIGGSEKLICRPSPEFQSPHVIERCSNRALNNAAQELRF